MQVALRQSKINEEKERSFQKSSLMVSRVVVHVLHVTMHSLPPPIPLYRRFVFSSPLSARSIPDLDQVITQLLDHRGRGTGLHALGVVCDEDGLCGLDDDDAFSALPTPRTSAQILPLPTICPNSIRLTFFP